MKKEKEIKEKIQIEQGKADAKHETSYYVLTNFFMAPITRDYTKKR